MGRKRRFVLMARVSENRLRDQRQRSRLTVAEVAKLLGVSPATISQWENGGRNIPLDRVPDIAGIFKVHTYELFTLDNEESDAT